MEWIYIAVEIILVFLLGLFIKIVLIIIFGVGISFFMYFPKSIENALNRIKYPFEVGEILASQQIDENLTAVIYTNKAVF